MLRLHRETCHWKIVSAYRRGSRILESALIAGVRPGWSGSTPPRNFWNFRCIFLQFGAYFIQKYFFLPIFCRWKGGACAPHAPWIRAWLNKSVCIFQNNMFSCRTFFPSKLCTGIRYIGNNGTSRSIDISNQTKLYRKNIEKRIGRIVISLFHIF